MQRKRLFSLHEAFDVSKYVHKRSAPAFGKEPEIFLNLIFQK